MLPKTPIHDIQSKFVSGIRGSSFSSEPLEKKFDNSNIYQTLVSNIFKNTLKNAYPIAEAILTSVEWHTLTDHFIANHTSNHAALWKMPEDFLLFAEEHDYNSRFGLPYLTDLLLFEWTEIFLFMMPDFEYPEYNIVGNVLEHSALLNQESKLLHLRFPVYRPLPQDKRTLATGNYFLFMFRHPDSFQVRFIEISPELAVLLEYIETGCSGYEAIEKVAEKMGNNNTPELENFKNNCKIFLQNMQLERVLLGTLT
jgi:uncharacterized protein